jgi:hypothetical protein
MPIQVQTQPGGQFYGFNVSRLQKVMEANTLQEAQRMGFLDKLTDTLFHGSAKQTAIRELFNSVVDPRPDQSAPADMVSRFLRLRDLAHEDQRSDFKTSYTRPGADNQWSFALHVQDTAIYSSPPDLADVPQTSFSAFHEEVMSDLVVQVTRKLAEMQKAEPSPLVDDSGYVNVKEVMALKEMLNNAVHSVDPEQPRFDVLDKLLSLHESKPLQAHQAFSALEQVRPSPGTNLLKILIGPRGPSPVLFGMATLLNHVVHGSKDTLDMAVQAKNFGRHPDRWNAARRVSRGGTEEVDGGIPQLVQGSTRRRSPQPLSGLQGSPGIDQAAEYQHGPLLQGLKFGPRRSR